MLRAMSCKDVAAHFNVDRKTIERLRIKYYRTGDVADLRRSGAPRKTNAAEDRFIVTSHRRNRFKCATDTARNWVGRIQISSKTVIRRLAAQGIQSRRPVCKQSLSVRHRASRLTWALRYQRWTQQQWSNIIFSDEKTFVVDRKDSRKRCFRKK